MKHKKHFKVPLIMPKLATMRFLREALQGIKASKYLFKSIKKLACTRGRADKKNFPPLDPLQQV